MAGELPGEMVRELPGEMVGELPREQEQRLKCVFHLSVIAKAIEKGYAVTAEYYCTQKHITYKIM